MKPYLLERLEQHHDEREDHPASLTEYDLDQLEARARWGVTGAWIAVLAVLLLVGAFVRSEIALSRLEKSHQAATAALSENVRVLTEQLAERTAESRIASTAVGATEPSYDRLRGQVAAIGARQVALSREQEAIAARVEQQAAHVANLGLWRSGMDATRVDQDARLAALETSTKSRADGVDARLTALDRKVDSIDKALVAQTDASQSLRKKQGAMIAAVPLLLGPYIHILDHSGR